MKIENIIDDIKRDITELKDLLEERFRRENPGLIFSISLPDIEDLTTIKLIALSIEQADTRYFLSAHIHTHNGNRVFENEARETVKSQPVPHTNRHLFQDLFVDMLRDIIKRRKNKIRSGNKPGQFYNELQQYANIA